MFQLVRGPRQFGRAVFEYLVQRKQQLSAKFEPFTRPVARRARRLWLRAQVLRRRNPQLLLLPALIPVLVLLYQFLPVLWHRLTFEFDIEWTEGGGLLHADRILRGQPLYPPPNSGFMPFPYPPMHPFLIAVFSKVFGLSYKVARGVSLGAMIGTSFLLCREVSRSWSGTRWPWVWGVLALGLIVVGFPLAGSYYDLVRTDALALFFSVAACVAVQKFDAEGTRRQFALCIALFLAAALTKQLSALYVVWLLTFLFLRKPRQAIALGIGFALAVAFTVSLLTWTSDGGFLVYTYHNLGKHHINWDTFRNGAKALEPSLNASGARLVWNVSHGYPGGLVALRKDRRMG
jgi:hypothetical protein